ncbi:cation:dicarboxylate symporter family transporter [Gordonia malaquae]|uniref:cation:dicarboxylate symporter family transporter n=1 Tax=Gordonia malaquae TaxID=410332 RepID=UPI0030FEAF3D
MNVKPAPSRTPIYRRLFPQLIVGIVAGILVGWLAPVFGANMKPFSDGFLALIKMVIEPIIFCLVVVGIAHVGDLKSVGRIGVKALIYFEAGTTFALVFGLVIGNVMRPGAGFRIDPATLSDGAAAIDEATKDGSLPHFAEFLLGVIPSSAINAFATNNTLQVLFFSVLFGLALATFSTAGPTIVGRTIEQLGQIFFKVMGWIMRLSPIGAFGAMASIIGKYGIASLASFGRLIFACYVAAALFILLLALVARLAVGLNLWKFLRYTKDEFALALGTASTEAVMPKIMEKLTHAGCSRAATGLVVPTGYSFNLDGATLYLAICLVFLAQALGVDLSLGEQITAVLLLMLTSKGMAGVPGSSFLALSATVTALGHPEITIAAVALLLGVDRIMDSMRVSVNLLGNCVATFVVAKWEGQLDTEQMRKVMDGEDVPNGQFAEPTPDPAAP